MSAAPAPVLVFAWGNPSRGDDALGPELARRLELERADAIRAGALQVLTDFQLQPEHALDLVGRRQVFFVDASTTVDGPCALEKVVAAKDRSFTTHRLSPAALLHTLPLVDGGVPPECWLLAVRGVAFELGAGLSPAAAQHLEVALRRLNTALDRA